MCPQGPLMEYKAIRIQGPAPTYCNANIVPKRIFALDQKKYCKYSTYVSTIYTYSYTLYLTTWPNSQKV